MAGKGGGGSQVIGYRYYLSLLMGLCRGPVDEILEIKVGGRTAWSGSVTSTSQIQISAASLFGGDDKEGGIEGPLDFLFGDATQVLADGNATALLTFNSQPAVSDTVTLNGQVLTFITAPDVPEGDGGGSGGGGESGSGGEGGGESEGE